MADLAALADPTYRPRRGPICYLGNLLKTMPDVEASNLRAALANVHAPSTMIAAALSELGHPVRSFNVQRHRRGECRCDS